MGNLIGCTPAPTQTATHGCVVSSGSPRLIVSLTLLLLRRLAGGRMQLNHSMGPSGLDTPLIVNPSYWFGVSSTVKTPAVRDANGVGWSNCG